MRNIYKSFGSNEVLRGVNLDLYPGEALALIGGNGAGKSTLVKSVMGIHKPDAGEIFIAGEALEFSSPRTSLGRGVYLVPQEPMLFPNMTVEQNVLMGFRGKRSALRERLRALLAQLGWTLDLSRSARSLSIAEQQLAEILRGLLREARLLILDEPTSALTFDEVNALFGIIEGLKEKRIGIIYITHRLNEVFRIATHVAIMRDGVITLHGRAEEFSRETLVRGLLPEGLSPEGLLPEGREEEGARRGAPERKAPDYAERRPVLELRDYSGWGFADINLKVYPGEVLGLCGVVGAGRTELAMTIYGRDRVKSGRAFLDGEDITGLGTRRIIRKGVNYVPEDRFLNGVFPITGIAGNMSSALLGFLPGFLLNFRAEAGLAGRYLEEFRIRAAGPRQEMGSLSGGNQQKVVIGRALSTEPRLVIMDEPTRGIDAGARGDIYAIIAELKARNVAVLLISSDMEEIVELSDRAVTMFQGRINREFQREEITQDRLMSASFGLAGEAG